MDLLTRVDVFGDLCYKREDLAGFEREDWPSGAKVRQYTKMIRNQPNLPLLVGCSAFSAMPIYIAAAAEKFSVPAIVYVPGRKTITDTVRYAIERGVEVCEVRPCPGPSVYKARAKERGKLLGQFVRWDFIGALRDAKHQAQNIPDGVERVVIPTGSGLIAAGVLAGLANRKIGVLALAGSTMADRNTILENASREVTAADTLPEFELIRIPIKYEKFTIEQVPDGTPLDPFYAAKAVPYLRSGDCLWVTGLRPVCSMPKICQEAFAGIRISNML